MAIRMQGTWTVSVKSKSAAYSQRFIIEGADRGDGTYAGEIATPPVLVTGADWIVRVEHNPGSGWQDSDDQITFPVHSSFQYRFNIETNDSGADTDFNDLVLTCSMPATATDFLIYGSVSSYRGRCIFNPCFPRYVVIDSLPTLQAARRYPAIEEMIKKYYPEQLRPQPPNPPDPPPLFKPMILPLKDETRIPPKENLSIQLKTVEMQRAAKGKGKSKTQATLVASSVESRPAISAEKVSMAANTVASSVIDHVRIGSLVDRLKLFCRSDALEGVVLRFQEYDRTAAELAGGAYSGAGLREDLGVAVSDSRGNYIFRFSRSIAEFIEESELDTGAGESTVTQSTPDIIVQLIDVMAPGTVLWESAPYFNVPTLRRINICIPEVDLHLSKCVSGQVVQALGNIFIGPAPAGPPPVGEPVGYGPRVGFNNALGVDGRITSRNTTGPQNRCAAWFSKVDLFACFLDHPSVTHYTIRYRQFGSGNAWTPFSQELRHPLIAKAGLSGYDGELIGPHYVNLHVDGGPKSQVSAYLDIEDNSLYVSTHRDRRAQIKTWALSLPIPGPIQFWIEGYNGSGNRVAGAEDSFTLFIDNTVPFLDIDDNVSMLATTLGNCAKFNLPDEQPGAPLTVSFKADQAQGFLDSYELYMYKGATGSFNVTPPLPAGPPFRLRSYVHGDDLACDQLRGTFDDVTADLITGYVNIDLAPASGHWLEADQNFCAFSIKLTARMRVTNGYSGRSPNYATPVLIGIEA